MLRALKGVMPRRSGAALDSAPHRGLPLRAARPRQRAPGTTSAATASQRRARDAECGAAFRSALRAPSPVLESADPLAQGAAAAHALLEVGLQDTEVVLIAADRPLQRAQQPLGGVE